MNHKILIGLTLALSMACFGCTSSGGGGGTPEPFANLAPTDITFPTQNIDSTGAAMTATLANTGDASLSVTGVSASGDFAESNNCPASLAAGANCTINVTFTPSAAGSRSGTLTVNDNSSGSAQSVGLTGVGGAAAFYVDTKNGNDSWSGTLAAPNSGNSDGPFKTFHQARLTVQGLNKTGLSQIVVQFRAGTYFLAMTEQFTAADSGTAATEIVYENYPGESPIISGGMRVQNWTNASANIWKATLPASTVNFENLFYNGVRRLRPRLGGSSVGAYLRVAATYYSATQSATCPPPVVTGSGYECFDRFKYAAGAPITNTWQNLAPPIANPCSQPAGNVALVGDIEVLDFEQFTASKLRISCVDTTNQIVYLTGPTTIPAIASQAGFITGHRYLVENVKDALTQAGGWFLDRSVTPWTLTYLANGGENPNNDTVVVPQLTQVLVASGLQYVTFQGLTFMHDNFVIPAAGYQSQDLDATLSAAVSFQNSQHIIFNSDIVTQTAGSGVEFLSCVNGQSPAWCVSTSASAVTANNLVENSAFYELGGAGVRIGAPEKTSDTDANLPQFITVQNSVIEGYGRVFPSVFGIAQGVGHDNTFMHNDVYEGYHVGISICVCGSAAPSSSGPANNTISFNHVHDTHQGIMNDGGAIRIAAGNGVFTAAGNKILNNKVHDVSSASSLDGTNNDPTCVPTSTLPCDGYGGDGIYLDNQSGLIDVENNLVYRVSETAINFPKTPPAPNEPNTVKNNIIAFARTSMINDSEPYPTGNLPNLTFIATNNLIYFDRTDTSAQVPFYVQGGCTYSGMLAYTNYQQWDSNMYWRTDSGFGGDQHAFHVQPNPGNSQLCSGNTNRWTFLYFGCTLTQTPCWQGQGEETHGMVQNPGFNNPAYPGDDYSLPRGSPGVGFVVFNPDLAGRSNPVISPPVVPATFLIKPFNPATDF